MAVAGEDLTVGFATTAQFLKKKAEDRAHRVTVTQALRDVTGRRWRVSYELRDELDAHGRPDRAEHSEEEWVRRFMEEFDAEELSGEWASSPGPESVAHRGESAGPVSSREKGA